MAQTCSNTLRAFGAVSAASLLLGVITFCSPCALGRVLEHKEFYGLSTSAARPAARRLASAPAMLVRQCDWAPEGRCVLGSEYASRSLAASQQDPVSQYVARSLACARVTNPATCDADVACAWDPAFEDGEEGCFLSDSQLLAVQQLCVQSRYGRALGALQSCMAERRSCRCDADGAGGACARLASSAEGCQSLLGCWLARLQERPFDLVQLLGSSFTRINPLLTTLTPNATAVPMPPPPAAAGASSAATAGPADAGVTAASGRRRRLLQPAGLNAPLTDDPAAAKRRRAAAGAPPPAAAPQKAGAAGEEGGQNKPIMSDSAPTAGAGGGGVGKLESASQADAGIIKADTTAPTAYGGASAGAGGDGSDALPYAPPSFWKCLADAAAGVDAAQGLAGVDPTSQKLSLDTWLKGVPKQALVPWSIKALDCFEQQAAISRATGVAVVDNADADAYTAALGSLGAALAALSSAAAAAGGAEGPAAALAMLEGGALPAAAAPLASACHGDAHASCAAGTAAVARAVLADAAWFVREARAVGGDLGQAAAALAAIGDFADDHARRVLRWLFTEQFGGPRNYYASALPPPLVPAGVAAAQALATLAAAQLPAAGVALTDPRWLQGRSMAVHAMLSAAALGPARGAAADAAAALGALGGAHVADFWAARAGAAAAGAAADAGLRALAFDDRAITPGWREAASGLVAALIGLRREAATLGSTGDAGAAPTSPTAQMRDGMARLLAGIALSANAALDDAAAAAVAAAATRASALADAAAACGAAGGGGAPACGQLDALAAELLQGVLGDLGAADALFRVAADSLSLQWRCLAQPPWACGAVPGCERAVVPFAPVLAAYPQVAPLQAPPEAVLCQASERHLTLRGAGHEARSALALGESCLAFLDLPACEQLGGGAGACAAHPACQWRANGTRTLMRTAAAGAGTGGVCATDWQRLIAGAHGSRLPSVLDGSAAECTAQATPTRCSALIAPVEPSAGGHSSPTTAVATAVIAAAAAVTAAVCAGIVLAVRRHRAVLDAAAAEAGDAEGGPPRGRKRRGSNKKQDKGSLKRKIKRSEPGEYKPDLMRDSFTDYLHRPAFRAGVAIAAANMAAADARGDGAGTASAAATGLEPAGVAGAATAAAVSAAEASAGERGGAAGGAPQLLLEPTWTFISGVHAPSAAGSVAGAPPAGSGPSGPLIELGSYGSGEPLISRHDRLRLHLEQQAAARQGQQQEQQQVQAHEASAAATSRPAGGASAPPSRSPFLRTPFQQQQSQEQQPPPRPAVPGLPPRPWAAAPLAPAARHAAADDASDGEGGGTPTSSCCHDSVCTFRHVPGAPGSVAESVMSRTARTAPRGALCAAAEDEDEHRSSA